MRQLELKQQLLNQFDSTKLAQNSGEWAFTNMNSERDVKVVGYATNISPAIISRAAAKQVDFLVTHHDAWDFVYGLRDVCEAQLRTHHIAHGFFHAVLDDADFGTSAALIERLGMKGAARIISYGKGLYCGRLGTLATTISFQEFSNVLTDLLQEPIRKFQNNNQPVKRVCVTAGGGNMTTDMRVAVEMGCDTYITGEYSLYSQQYAELVGINLLVGSHTNTEIFGVERLVKQALTDSSVQLVRIFEENY